MAGVMKFPQPFHSVIFIVGVLIAGATKYGGVEAQSPGCATSMATLSPCVGYITSNFTPNSPPPQSCCTALSSVVKTSAVCLCQLLTASGPFAFPINQTQALALPGACNITTPPLTRCKVATAPSPAPSAAPVAGPSNPVLPPTGNGVPSSSPSPATSVPNVPTPNSQTPSFVPPTTSVGGNSPASRAGPTSNTGTLFTPSKIISVLAGVIALSAMF